MMAGHTEIESRLVAAIAAEKAAEDARVAARIEFAVAVEDARAAGVTWKAIAALAGVTESAMIYRLKGKHWPSTWREPKPRVSLKGAKYKTQGPGLSIEEFSAQEGFTRVTGYRHEKAGRLITTTNDLGRLRVLGWKPGSEPFWSSPCNSTKAS